MGPERKTWLEAARIARVFSTTTAQRGRKLADERQVEVHLAVARALEHVAGMYEAEARRFPLGDDENTPPDGTALAMSRTPLAMPAPVLPDLPDTED